MAHLLPALWWGTADQVMHLLLHAIHLLELILTYLIGWSAAMTGCEVALKKRLGDAAGSDRNQGCGDDNDCDDVDEQGPETMQLLKL